MLGTTDLWLFVLAGLALNVTPGPDTMYILGRSATQGAKAGALAALGISAGCVVHILAATLGLSALLLASSTAFMGMKFLGAAYLIYLGITMLRAKAGSQTHQSEREMAGLRTVFWQGFLTNVLNPKVALFFLAFLPQFIAAEAPRKWLAMLFLGLLFNFNGTLWNLFVAWSSARITTQFKVSSFAARSLNRLCGGLFIYFGYRLAKSES
jgi:threonine/homoserine/homoserine lactone efflux protein